MLPLEMNKVVQCWVRCKRVKHLDGEPWRIELTWCSSYLVSCGWLDYWST